MVGWGFCGYEGGTGGMRCQRREEEWRVEIEVDSGGSGGGLEWNVFVSQVVGGWILYVHERPGSW